MRLVPIDINTDQERLAETLATTLCREGVRDILALPLAIGIMGALQAAADDKLDDAIRRLEQW